MSEAFAANPIVRAVGLALVQFLWQGAAIGALTALVLAVLRRRSAQARYAVACLGVIAMLAAPIATVASHLREPAVSASASVLARPATPPRSSQVSQNDGTDSTSEVVSAPLLREWLDRQLPLIVLTWGAGVLLLALHLLRGWVQVTRLRRNASPVNVAHWRDAVRRMADRLGITREIRLLESAALDVPAVIGWLRPAIIVPVSALAGLAPAQLEAILAHELAHVRRGDYVMNVFQRIVETLLFYQPAVWWVSRQVRIERENCCDDLAVSLCADRVAYAEALTSLEELRAGTPTLAMGARGGELLHRIRRLVEPKPDTGPKLSGGVAMSVVFTVLLFGLSGYLPSHARVAPVQGVAVTSRGTASGVVSDPSGGRMPGVQVTFSSPTTRESRTVFTNSSGQYTVADLTAGAYDLTIALAGFKTSKSRVEILAGRTITSSVALQLGALSETINVLGDPSTASTPPSAPPLPPAPTNLQTSAEYFDAAKLYYFQGRFADAEMLTALAVEMRDAEMPPAADASTTPVPGVIRVGGNISEPRKIHDVKPIYPGDALSARVEGFATIEAIISKNGTVKDARVIKSLPLLDDAALGAVRQWQFSPTQLNRVPVEVTMTVTVVFSVR